MSTGPYPAPGGDLRPLGRRALLLGAAAAAACAIGLAVNPAQLFRSYLVAWMLWLGVALGSLAIQMLHHLSRGAWGLVIRRILEAAARTLPVLVLLFVPLAFGLKDLYPWARADAVAADEHLRHQAPYLNVPFVLGRLAASFAIWIAFAAALGRLSRRQDATAEPALERRMQLIAAPGLALYCLTMTFVAIDLLMSIDPHWVSAIYGVYVIGGQAVSAMAFSIAALLYLSRREPLAGLVQPRHFHDLGKLLLAFTMLWAYFALSQFLIIWSGDLPEEIGFYADRRAGGWSAVSLALVVFHFALPLALLLSRDLKRDARKLAAVAALLLLMRWVDLFWLVSPAFHPTLALHWLDVAAPIAIGGIWLWRFAGALAAEPVLPVHDAGLPAALEVAHHV